MQNINPNEISQELLAKAQACETAEELLKLAKENGYELTKDEAEAYIAEGATVDLSDEEMARVAGGISSDCWTESCKTVIYD
ncbi:MAG: Nif11-like leader peptide family RiPP precursor [Schwartzia sp.]|nr:Nif11-like leader peptide family RiPP precursor [Schwartzia sp. (in: firmicutes)]